MLNLLIIKPSSLGDVIHGMQIVFSIKKQIKDCHVSWVIRDDLAPLLKCCPAVIDSIIPFHRYGTIKQFFDVIKDIRKQSYDVVIDLQGLARSGLLAMFAQSTRKIGRSDAREFSKFCYSEKMPFPSKKNPHAIDILAECLPMLGLKKEISRNIPWDLPKVDFLNGTFLRQNYILMFPNSQRSEKEWPYFVELTDEILNKFPNRAVVWAGNKQITHKKEWESKLFYNFIGKTSVQDLITLIYYSNLVISNDSGPMHLAATLDKKIVCLFGPTDPQKFGPYPTEFSKHNVFQSDDIRKITVSSVLETVSRISEKEDKQFKSNRPNLYLVGFMGTGKTRIGRNLAKDLKMQFIDSDEHIEVKEGMSISDIYEQKGVEYLEKKQDLFFSSEGHPKNGTVIACGGAVPLKSEMIENFKENGIVIGLFASSEKILKQTQDKKRRPLLLSNETVSVTEQKTHIENLLNSQTNSYLNASYCLNTDGKKPIELAKRIVSIYSQKMFKK